MRVVAKLWTAACAAVLFGVVGVANADDKTPSNQGLESVDKNLKRDPDNRGLENAQQRIEDNIKDRERRETAKSDRDHKTTHKNKDRARRDHDDTAASRPERAERAGR